MTNEEIFCSLADELRDTLSAGVYGAWEDLCVEYAIQDPFRPGYIIVVWGRELDKERESICTECEKYYSVSIHRAGAEGRAEEKLLTTYSDSDDLYDLENAVYAALRKLDHMHRHKPLNEAIDSAAKNNPCLQPSICAGDKEQER